MVTAIDWAQFKRQVVDGTFCVIWDRTKKQWIIRHAIDAKDILLQGAATLSDPAGNGPPADLLRSKSPPFK